MLDEKEASSSGSIIVDQHCLCDKDLGNSVAYDPAEVGRAKEKEETGMTMRCRTWATW